MIRRSNWRDLKEWKKSGLPFSTTSDEACKLYDAALTQYAGYYNDPALGGLGRTLAKLMEADPSAAMGHVIRIGLQVFSTSKHQNDSPDFRKQLQAMTDLKTNNNISDWEKRHISAAECLAAGRFPEAWSIWEDILLDYPLDMLAIKLAFDVHIYMGSMTEMRDVLAQVTPQWTPDVPLYSILLGLHSFCLCETNLFRKGEILGRKGLELDPCDGWATHALVHIYEMEGRYDDGIKLLQSTVKNWEPQDIIACHNYWHWAVYKITKADYEGALNIFDSEVYPRTAKDRTPFNISDSSALLRRLEMEGVSVGERWQDVYEICRPYAFGGDNFAFYDAHYMISALGAKKKTDAAKILEDIKEFMKNGDTFGHLVKRNVGAAVCESLLAFDEGNYAEAVNILYPLRYKICEIGGSIAQRDVIHQFLIHAAMNSPETRHNKIARCLLAERKSLVETSELTDRLIEKTLLAH